MPKIKYVRKIDLISLAFMGFIWLKFIGHCSDSNIIIVFFYHFLKKYINKKDEYKSNRPGELWVVVWLLYANVLFWVNIVHPEKYIVPVNELGFVIFTVLMFYYSYREEKKNEMVGQLNPHKFKVYWTNVRLTIFF